MAKWFSASAHRTFASKAFSFAVPSFRNASVCYLVWRLIEWFVYVLVGNWFEDWLTARQKRTEMRRVSGCGIALQWHKKREPSTAQRAKWTGLSGAHRSEVIHTRNECILCMRVLLVRVIYVSISIYWFLFFLRIVRFLVGIWLRKKSFLAKHNKDVDWNKPKNQKKNRFNESVSDRHKTIRFSENNS